MSCFIRIPTKTSSEPLRSVAPKTSLRHPAKCCGTRTRYQLSACVAPLWGVALAIALGWSSIAVADTVTMKNGTQYTGDTFALSELDESASGGANANLKPIWGINDGLRITYVPKSEFAFNPVSAVEPSLERIEVKQLVVQGSNRSVGGVGEMMSATAWNDMGRRTVRINTERGIKNIYQGITEITPTYCVVETLQSKETSYQWRMRIATSSIPRSTLSKIMYRQLDEKNPDQRLRIVFFYTQAQRYADAAVELEGVARDFPDLKDLSDKISRLRAENAERLIREIELRRDAGQYALVHQMIERFPTENIPNSILSRVREMMVELEQPLQIIEEVKGQLEIRTKRVFETGALDEKQKVLVTDLMKEITADLNPNNLARFAAFRILSDDPSKTDEQLLALAIGGWLMGSGEGGDGNLVVVVDQIKVRALVREYLACDDPVRRKAILEELNALEGSQPADLAKIVSQLLPVVDPPQENESEIPGFYHLTIPGPRMGEDLEYYVQLPPLYDPYRRYPAIMTLGGGTTAKQQIDWWAGDYNPRIGMRMGQASRHGYVVIAPVWRDHTEIIYHYSVEEHAKVLFSLNDALKRFSIDTDRVFLSGHSDGGSAAWDIGLSHPDHWAGILPIVATSDRYVSHYIENARDKLGMYFVHGQKDHRRMIANKTEWNKYFKYANFDVTMTEYLGRGHEDFHEDQPRMFDWMKLHRRQTTPKEFEATSLRPTDNYFWWVEAEDLLPATIRLPEEWGVKEFQGRGSWEAKVQNGDYLLVKAPSDKVTVWLTPDLIDLDKPFKARINGLVVDTDEVRPDRETLLEDVRRRCDRQHPFWAKLVFDKYNR